MLSFSVRLGGNSEDERTPPCISSFCTAELEMRSNTLVIIRGVWRTLLLYYLLSPVSHLAESASECDGGTDIFATVRENSPMGEFIANLTITGDPSANHITLSLTGADADWFYLEGKTIRLNSTQTRILDREVHGSLLMATVTCYEDGVIQREHRITAEILNKNDNRPEFLHNTTRPVEISELTTVNSTVFTVRARDADGDILIYGIDESSPDGSYFRLDLPNSGQVILNRALDYETKPQLQLILYAMEMITIDHFNTTVTITINVTDGDDQYPQFQPCILLSISQGSPICANPLYTVNITEQDEDIVLDFSPGPVHAVDGDEGLKSPLTYTILSGADNGRFVIHSVSGEVRLTRRVENRLLTPTLRLRIMASQSDDPMKYSVATALVRVLAENRFPPQFGRSAYRGFVSESTSPASLVNTYGNELLMMEVTDRDFVDGVNPRLQFSLSPDSNVSQLYSITQEGFLIAKANQLQPNHRHSLEVLATDQESGDVAKAVIEIDVLQKGTPVPWGPLEEGQPHESGIVGRTGGMVGMCLILLTTALVILVCFIRRKRRRQDPANHASVAEGKHPNVSLRWFQLVNHSRSQPQVEEVFYHNEAFSGYDTSTSTLHGKQGSYTKTDQPKLNSSLDTSNTPTAEDVFPAVKTNGKPVEKSITKSVSFQDFVVVRECESHGDEDRNRSDSTDLEDIDIDVIGMISNPDESERFGPTLNPELDRDTQAEAADPEKDHEAGQNIRDLPEAVGTSEEASDSDNTTSKDGTKGETSDSRRSITTNPDISEEEAEIADVKCSRGPNTSTVGPSGTVGDGLKAGDTEREEGNMDVKIVVTFTDTDETNGDDEDFLIPGASDSPQLCGSRAEDASSKDPSGGKYSPSDRQTDGEDIATNLDNASLEEGISPDLTKPALNHADLNQLPANTSDTEVHT